MGCTTIQTSSLTLHGLTPIYMAMSSHDIAVLKQTIIYCISLEIGFPILAEKETQLMFNIQH